MRKYVYFRLGEEVIIAFAYEEYSKDSFRYATVVTSALDEGTKKDARKKLDARMVEANRDFSLMVPYKDYEGDPESVNRFIVMLKDNTLYKIGTASKESFKETMKRLSWVFANINAGFVVSI